MDAVVNIPGYTIFRNDRTSDTHDGMRLYIEDGYSKYQQLSGLSCCSDHVILWVHLRPKRFPRGFFCLIIAVVYHPHWTAEENDSMHDHLFQLLSLAESKFPNKAVIIAGDRE